MVESEKEGRGAIEGGDKVDDEDDAGSVSDGIAGFCFGCAGPGMNLFVTSSGILSPLFIRWSTNENTDDKPVTFEHNPDVVLVLESILDDSFHIK